MKVEGIIRKMQVSQGDPVSYQLPLGDQKISMNELIGREIKMSFLGNIQCIRCGRETKKSFAQGYCYPCFVSAPETEECVLRPELCRAHEGIARDMDYAQKHCLSEQVVYLSLTSGLKVGVTRASQVPVRWIDQGAIKAIELARVPNRFTAGRMELALKAKMSDKTNWRKMLTGDVPLQFDLAEEKERVSRELPEELKVFASNDNKVQKFKYPVERYPEKIKSLNFDKEPEITGLLSGIKGQYLLFDDNRVINIRKFGAYEIRFQTG